MKKCAVFFCCLTVFAVAAAVWFSPLCFPHGNVSVYENNAPVLSIDGAACYSPTDVVRVDLSGGENELRSALDRMCAEEVKRVELDGLTVVYAFSPRVCAKALTLADGGEYNVMLARRGDSIAIGAPVLEGSY